MKIKFESKRQPKNKVNEKSFNFWTTNRCLTINKTVPKRFIQNVKNCYESKVVNKIPNPLIFGTFFPSYYKYQH